jgi:hypothetical protein
MIENILYSSNSFHNTILTSFYQAYTAVYAVSEMIKHKEKTKEEGSGEGSTGGTMIVLLGGRGGCQEMPQYCLVHVQGHTGPTTRL